MQEVIYIPTYKRANSQYTYKALPKQWKERAVLVVAPDDENNVKFYNRDAKILVQPPEIKTIAQKRAWIVQQSTAERLVMMDDDLVFAMRHNKEDFKLRRVEGHDEELAGFLDDLFNQLKTYAHAGISPRQGNNRTPWGWHETKRMIYAFGFDVATAKKEIEWNRVECREDMDYTLQLLKKGYNNVVGFQCAVDQKKFNAPGGASTERTMELSNEQAEKLAELHPGLVKVVEKEYKSSIPRKEVIVQWKKAYESSQTN